MGLDFSETNVIIKVHKSYPFVRTNESGLALLVDLVDLPYKFNSSIISIIG